MSQTVVGLPPRAANRPVRTKTAGAGHARDFMSWIVGVLFLFGLTTTAWAEPGIDARRVVLGSHQPLTGPASEFSAIGHAEQAWFQYVNDLGGIHGRQIELRIRDDRLQPERAVEAIRTLVVQDQVFALFASVGKRTHAAAQPTWASFQLPDFFVQSNAPEWTDPARPGVFAFEPTPEVEARVLGQYLLRKHGGERIVVWHASKFREAAFMLLRHGFTPQVQRKESDTSPEALQGIVKSLKQARPQVVVALAEYGDLLRFLQVFDAEGGSALVYTGTALADSETPRLLSLAMLKQLRLLTALPLALEQDHPGIQLHRKLLEVYAPDLVMSRWTIQGQAAAELMTAVLERSGRDLSASTALRSAERLDLPKSHLLPPVALDSQQHRALTSLRVIQLHPDRVDSLSDWIDGR